VQAANGAGWRARAGILAAFAALLCALWWSGALREVFEPERVRAFLVESGWLGPAAWCLAFAVLQPFGVPGMAFMIPAALVWPPVVAIGVCLAGATLATAFAFALSRWMGREAILARMPEGLRRRTARAREHGFRTALVLRLVLFLFPPAHWALGISGIRLGPLLAGSFLGFVPAMTLWILATREFFAQLERLPLAEAVGLGVAALALGGGVWWWRRRRAAPR
jgi:uncharacterized membrane protein YdjX (TVP38/TMEM64 family)